MIFGQLVAGPDRISAGYNGRSVIIIVNIEYLFALRECLKKQVQDLKSAHVLTYEY